MKTIFKILLLTFFIHSAYAVELPKNHVVSTDWLMQHSMDKNIVIIDTRKSEVYRKSHIKNAVNIPKADWFKGEVGNIKKLYNTPTQVEEMFSKAGIVEDSIIVFYSAGLLNKDYADAASGFWTAWLYGFKNIVILNGGFAKWVEEKKKISTAITKVTTSDIEIESFDKSVLASLGDITEAMYSDDIQITDARVGKFYRGEDDRKDLARHGRVVTAKLTPAIRQTQKVGNYFEFISSSKSKKVLENGGYGIDLQKPLIIYCNTGHKARGLWFVTKFIDGMSDVKVYDGSIVEYSRTLLPMDDGEPMD